MIFRVRSRIEVGLKNSSTIKCHLSTLPKISHQHSPSSTPLTPTHLHQAIEQLNSDPSLILPPALLARLLRNLLTHNNYHAFQNTLAHQHLPPHPSDGPQALHALAEIFDGLAHVGRGIGIMRRTMRTIHKLGYPSGSEKVVEAYVGVLIRWGRLDRALAYLQMFNFGISNVQSPSLNPSISNTLTRSNLPKEILSPSSKTWARLMSIYLLLGYPKYVLELSRKCEIESDECSAHQMRAQAIISQDSSPNQNVGEQLMGPATAEVALKLAYQNEGPHTLFQRLITRTRPQEIQRTGMSMVSAWLDSLLDPTQPSYPETTPASLGEALVRMAKLKSGSLVTEVELEKYLQYQRQWLERMVDHKIRDSFGHKMQSHPTTEDGRKKLLTVDPDDPQIGYQYLAQLLALVYQTEHRTKLEPSSVTSAELSRIEALIGRPSASIRRIIGESVVRPNLGLKTSHMVGLVWSKLAEADLVGLLELLERELKFSYRLVLTGLLVSLVLGGLVAIRVPKIVLLQFSHRLGDQQQQPSRPNPTDDGPGPASYVRAARAAAAAGNFFLVRELHEEMVNRYGHTGYADAAGRNEEGGMSDYLAMLVESLMRLNEPVQAHREVLAVLADAKVLEAWVEQEDEEDGLGRRECFYLANDEMRRYLIEREPTLLLVDHRSRRPFRRRLVNTLRDSKRRLQTKMDRLKVLSESYGQAGGVEEADGGRGKMFGKKSAEVEERLRELRVANGLNEELMKIWKERNRKHGRSDGKGGC